MTEEPMLDLTTLTDEDFTDLDAAVTKERSRRATLQTVPQQMAELNRAYLGSSGVVEGDPWRQPTSAADAYPKDWVTEHNSKTWSSLVDANVWEPTADNYALWRNLTDQPAEGEWAPGVAYETGQTVTYNGVEYVCIQAHTSNTGWEPPLTAALWQPVEGQ